MSGKARFERQEHGFTDEIQRTPNGARAVEGSEQPERQHWFADATRRPRPGLMTSLGRVLDQSVAERNQAERDQRGAGEIGPLGRRRVGRFGHVPGRDRPAAMPGAGRDARVLDG